MTSRVKTATLFFFFEDFSRVSVSTERFLQEHIEEDLFVYFPNLTSLQLQMLQIVPIITILDHSFDLVVEIFEVQILFVDVEKAEGFVDRPRIFLSRPIRGYCRWPNIITRIRLFHVICDN